MPIKHTNFLLLAILIFTLVPRASNPAGSPFSMQGNLIIDQSGSEIQVTTPFKRIISLYGAHTENLLALGCDKEIIGVSPKTVFPPEAQHRPAFHYREDAEKFLAAGPDLVLIRPMIARGYPRLVERLQASGITVVSLQPGDVTEMFLYWRILGLLTGRREKAEAMVREFQGKVAAFRALSEGIEPKKRVYFESIHAKMKTFSADAMAVYALECAGGINLAADALPALGSNIADFGKERILARGDKIDVYLAQIGPMNRPTIETIRNEPGFQVIRAVRSGDIYLIDETLVSRPTLRLLEGITAIGRILYPDRFGDPVDSHRSPEKNATDGP